MQVRVIKKKKKDRTICFKVIEFCLMSQYGTLFKQLYTITNSVINLTVNEIVKDITVHRMLISIDSFVFVGNLVIDL